ncbi:MAG: hypothetical protein ACNA8W_13080 [Bradymonadaceae bacterium]
MNRQPEDNKAARTIKGIIGAFLVLFSMPCVAMMIHDIIVGTDNLAGAIGAGGFFGILATIGFFLIYLATRKPPERPLQIDERTERMILHVARINEGKLTQAHLAMQSSLTLEQASIVLTEFERRGVAYSVVGHAGGMEYVFPDLALSTDRSHEEFLLDLNSPQAAGPDEDAEREEVAQNAQAGKERDD